MTKIKKRELVNLLNNDLHHTAIAFGTEKAPLEKIQEARKYQHEKYIKPYLKFVKTGVIASGFQIQPGVMFNGSPDETVNKILTDFWNDWARSPIASDDNINLTTALQQIATRLEVDGEVFILCHESPVYRQNFAIQIIPADFCPYEQLQHDPLAVNGIRYDTFGKPTHYYFKTDGQNYKPYPAERVIHFYDKSCGSLRGESTIYPVIQDVKRINNAINTHLLAAISAAETDRYLETPDPELVPTEQQRMTDPGITILPEGTRIVGVTSQAPDTRVTDFTDNVIASIAGQFGVSFNLIKRTVERSSFSGLRFASSEDVRTIIEKQNFIASQLLVPLFKKWLMVQLQNQNFPIPFPVDRYDNFTRNITFAGETPTPIDGDKTATSMLPLIEAGVVSVDRVTRKYFGISSRQMYEEIRRDEELKQTILGNKTDKEDSN